MLITTSRKPSPRTRTFSRSLERVSNSKYINRGKMSIRDVLIKSSGLGFNQTAIVSEVKGNPSRIEFYSPDGDSIMSFDITVSINSSKGRIKKSELRLRYEVELREDMKEKIVTLLGIPSENGSENPENLDHKPKPDSNLLWIKKGEKGSKAVIEFYDQHGQKTGPKIFLHHCRNGFD